MNNKIITTLIWVAVAYRFYAVWITSKVLLLDQAR